MSIFNILDRCRVYTKENGTLAWKFIRVAGILSHVANRDKVPTNRCCLVAIKSKKSLLDPTTSVPLKGCVKRKEKKRIE